MDNASLQKIKDILANSGTIGIAVAQNPTVDEMGGALALYLTLQAQNKSVSIASPTEPIVELSSLVGIDKVRPALGTGGNTSGDLIVSFPYHEGEIEKVSYTIDNGLLNIVVKAGERGLTFSEQDVRFSRGSLGSGSIDALFVIGAAKLSDLGPIYNPEALKDTKIINIDNKSENQGYGDIVFVSPRFSSVSEQVADMLYGLGFDVDVDAAQNLMSGIAFATGNFQSPQTSSLAFEMAALLMRKGASRAQTPPVSQGQDAMAQFGLRQQAAPQQPPMPQQQRAAPGFRTAQQPYTQPAQPGVTNTSRDPQEAIRQALRSVQQQSQAQLPNTPPQQPPAPQQPEPQQSADGQENNGRFDQKPPSDWLTPKVYKGSSNV